MLKACNNSLPVATATVRALALAVLAVPTLTSPSASAVEVLAADELAAHCASLKHESEGVDAQYCVRYIQGFIDGAVATDVRVMLNAENAVNREETYGERAMRTRAPSPEDRFRAANLAEFCLGDPLPLRSVVDAVVADLEVLSQEASSNLPAMAVVYASLRQRYPCNP